MDKAQRKKNPKVENEVLLKSKRRCCLCFGLNQDLKIKNGQIAHLDHDSSNDKLDNLAFLCFDHHNQYDSITSQSKSIQINEVKTYRDELYQLIETGQIFIGELNLNSFEKELSGQKSSKTLNAWLTDKAHKCSYCGYSFSIMPELEKGKNVYVKQATCPKCDNLDEVDRFYKG